MAIKKNESIEVTVESDGEQHDRDIRRAPFEEDDFNFSFTDSTCPINEAIAQVREPGFDYIAAYKDPRRINALLAKKWVFVDPSILKNRPTFNIDERTKDMITIGDTILMKRDSRYSEREEQHQVEKNRSMMASSLSGFKRSKDPITQITNIDNPFSN